MLAAEPEPVQQDGKTDGVRHNMPINSRKPVVVVTRKQTVPRKRRALGRFKVRWFHQKPATGIHQSNWSAGPEERSRARSGLGVRLSRHAGNATGDRK